MTSTRHELDPGDGGGDDVIEIGRHLGVLWRHRLVIVAVALLCAVAALVAGLLTPRVYEATTRLIVSAPPPGAANEAAPTITVATFRALLENQSLAAGLIAEFGLNKPPHELTPGTFISRSVTVETPRDTSIVIVRVRLRDADLAAKVANRLAAAATDRAQQMSQNDVAAARDVLKATLDQSSQRLDQAASALESFRRTAQIELLRKDVDSMLGQRGELLSLLLEIQTEKARLSQAEAQLATRQRVDTLRRSIDSDPASMEAARKAVGEAGSVLPLQLRTEEVNKVYESLDEVVAATRTKLAGLEKRRAELVDVRRLDQNQQAKLSLLYRYEMQESRLQTDYDLANWAYMDAAREFEQARVQAAGRGGRIDTMDTALPPDGPVSKHVFRLTGIATVGGFLLAIIGVLAFDSLRQVITASRS